jgi:homogentisate phytyltransferase / homogentisate geranylgeranyltransferase
MILSAVAAPAERRARRAASALEVLWRFSRPHTVIGTTVSIVGLYLIAVDEGIAPGVGDLALTLLAGLCVNVYIVGINQLEDVEIDRVNKPYLPIAAGDMTRERGRVLVAAAGIVPVVLALTQGPLELAAVLAGIAVGTAYSVPPLRLKRFPALASLSISGVRSVVVNLGVFAHFGTPIPAPVWALTLFVVPFAFAIAILKDVPDIEGDRRFRVMTFSVRMGARRVFEIGLAALVAAYLGMATIGPLAIGSADPAVLVAGHLAALALLWRFSREADVADHESFTRFYMRVWKLFFLEYAIVAVACLAG